MARCIGLSPIAQRRITPEYLVVPHQVVGLGPEFEPAVSELGGASALMGRFGTLLPR